MPKHDLAFLHTAHAHVDPFDKIAKELAADVSVRHVVREALLADAGRDVPAEVLAIQVSDAIYETASTGAKIVVCTCTAIGAMAEQTISDDFVAMRIDRPMAEEAVGQGSQILVIATFSGALPVARDLINDVAQHAGKAVTIEEYMVASAWDDFLQGDRESYIRRIAEAVSDLRTAADVVVFAQASMEPALKMCEDIGVPILCSPRIGVEAAIRRLRA